MALDTFSGLKSSIADWINRDDLTSVIPTFIELAEATFNRNVRTRDMVQRATASLDTQYTELPADFLQMINIQLNTTVPVKLSFVSNEQADDLRTQFFYSANQPKYYSIVGSTFEVIPSPSGEFEVEMSYYKKIAALTDSNTTNWLLTKSPAMYLYGALVQSAPYLRDDERIGTWGALYKEAFNDLMLEEQRTNFSGTTPRMRARGY